MATVPKLTNSRCRCSCGQFFNSVSAFDRHRVGDWRDRGIQRYCLTVLEMLAKGWTLNAAGFWVRAKRPVSLGTARAGAAIGTRPALRASTAAIGGAL
jgi:hypothetical protein